MIPGIGTEVVAWVVGVLVSIAMLRVLSIRVKGHRLGTILLVGIAAWFVWMVVL